MTSTLAPGADNGARPLPDPALWEFYMAYNLFRVSCIRQGVYARALDGTAATAVTPA